MKTNTIGHLVKTNPNKPNLLDVYNHTSYAQVYKQVDFANGNSAVYTYDNLNRLTKLEHSDSTRTIASYEYTLGDAGQDLKIGGNKFLTGEAAANKVAGSLAVKEYKDGRRTY
jgi:hypothetical protein